MEFKSQDIFSWDAEGNMNSPFAWNSSDETHEIILATLRQLGCPEWSLTKISEIRQENLDLPISKRYDMMSRYFSADKIKDAMMR